MKLTLKEFETRFGKKYPKELAHLKHNKCYAVLCSDITGHVLCGFYKREEIKQ